MNAVQQAHPASFVTMMVSGFVAGREIHEVVRVNLSRPLVLYDNTPDSDYREIVGYAVTQVQTRLHTTHIGRLTVHPKDWSDDVDHLNGGLVPLSDPL